MRATPPETAQADSEMLKASAAMNICGKTVELEFIVPSGEVPAEAILPLLHQFSEVVANIIEQGAEQDGTAISCTKGCGACCRQPVPVTRAEARQLASLVAALPPSTRSRVTERFERALERVREAGLGTRIQEFCEMDDERKQAMAQAYFNLGIACPFLEDESCSIHAQRPLVCREYLVVSDPVYCKRLDGRHIEGLIYPAPFSTIFSQLEGMNEPGESPFMLLVSALDWADHEHVEGRKRPGPAWLQEFVQKLSGSEIPAPLPHARGFKRA